MSASPPPEPLRDDWVNPDAGAQRVVTVLDWGEKIMLYNVLLERRGWAARRRSAFAYWWVCGWLAVLAGLLAITGLGSEIPLLARIAILVPVAYRFVELTRWWLDLLLDRRHAVVVSVERNLIFLGLNLLELAFVAAIVLRLAGRAPYGSVDSAWFAGFYLVAQLGLPATSGFWLSAAIAAVEGAALLLLLGGFALLIGLAAEKMRPGPWKHDWLEAENAGPRDPNATH